MCPWITSDELRSVMKAWVHCTIYGGRPFFLRVSKSQVGLTVSNAPDISNESKVATCCLDLQIVWICLVSSSSAVSVEQPGLALICVSGSRWCSSAALLSCLATRVSMTFPIVLNRAIGLYASGSEYVGFPGFCNVIVHALLNRPG